MSTTDEMWQKLKELEAEQNKNRTCPNCGYCPHCGRGHQAVPYYPVYPIYPQPYPWQPYITWTVTTTESPNVTCGTTANLPEGTVAVCGNITS